MITELIDDYKNLCLHVTEQIDRSGFKVDFVRERMHMLKPGFYAKRMKGNFTPDELKAIMKIIRINKTEEEVFGNLIAEHRNDPLLSEKETRKLILG